MAIGGAPGVGSGCHRGGLSVPLLLAGVAGLSLVHRRRSSERMIERHCGYDVVEYFQDELTGRADFTCENSGVGAVWRDMIFSE